MNGPAQRDEHGVGLGSRGGLRARLPGLAGLPFVGCFYVLILVGEAWLVAIVPLLPDLRERFILSGFQAGLLVGAVGVAMVVVSIPAGALADRLGAGRVTIGAAVLLSLSTFAQGYAHTYGSLLGARIVFGIALGVLWTAGADWLVSTVSNEHVERVMGRMITSAGVGIVVGPPVAGVLAAASGTSTVFVLGGALLAVSALLLALSAPAGSDQETAARPTMRHTLAVAGRSNAILGAALALAASSLTGSGLSVLVPIQLAANGMSDAAIGITFGVAAGLFIVASALSAHLGDARRTLLTLGLATFAFFICLAPANVSVATTAVVVALCSTASLRGLLAAVAYPLAARAAVRRRIGRATIIGLLNGAWGAGTIVGPLVAGAAHDALGTRSAYVVLEALIAAGLLFMLLRTRGSAMRVSRTDSRALRQAGRHAELPAVIDQGHRRHVLAVDDRSRDDRMVAARKDV